MLLAFSMESMFIKTDQVTAVSNLYVSVLTFVVFHVEQCSDTETINTLRYHRISLFLPPNTKRFTYT